jgi:hypothetical protein
MDFGYIKLPKGVSMRKPYQGEMDYFNKNQHVAGMATEDGKVILNPYSGLKPEEYQSVAINESARLLMKKDPSLVPNFELTDQQARTLDTGTYRNADPVDRRATIAARLLANDPSGGVPTAEQTLFVNDLKRKLFPD